MIKVDNLAPAQHVPIAQPLTGAGGVDREDADRDHKAALGQFLTPKPVAEFMAGFFEVAWPEVELLDPGAGAGALTAALVRRLCREDHKPRRISATVIELDAKLIEPLRTTLSQCHHECERAGISFSAKVLNQDFIAFAAPVLRRDFFAPSAPPFNVAIVNPPYRKIRSDSPERLLLRSAGIETSNLYTGFIALVTKLLTPGGELVAITPRSFCNGPYFKPFRADFLANMSLRRLHVFESRSEAFNGDDVLQENVIFHAMRQESKPKRVVISHSNGRAGSPVAVREVDYRDVISPGDPEKFIRLVVDDAHTRAKSAMCRLPSSLDELGINVSTGRVVDFRAEPYLRRDPNETTSPLIYPCHFSAGFVHWPKAHGRKPNAIVYNEQTQELLVPAGPYVLVKRFTSKEERRRVVACLYDPERVQAQFVGFENHLNYFHEQGRGLPPALAKGLVCFLNSTVVDVFFRQFSGHTQVNATDLRMLRYPSRVALERLGNKVGGLNLPQRELDSVIEGELF